MGKMSLLIYLVWRELREWFWELNDHRLGENGDPHGSTQNAMQTSTSTLNAILFVMEFSAVIDNAVIVSH